MATKKTVKKTTVKKPVVKKAVKKEECPTAMTRASFVETITDMCERLNESDLLDELNTVELEDGLTAEQLTDLFCDAVEFVDSVDKSGELDDDIVKFYESEPWKDLPDEDEEQEPEDDDPEPEDDTVEEDPEEEVMDEDPEGEPEPEDDAVEEEPEPEPEPTPKKKAAKVKPKKAVSKPAVKPKKAEKPVKNQTPVKKTSERTKGKTIEKVGVIQTIFELIKSSKKDGITKEQILEGLSDAFPERSKESMAKTINCQIGGKKRPCRLEVSKDVTLIVKEDAYSLK